MREAYLDNSATTRVCPEAAERAVRVMTETYGNPSSLQHKGSGGRAGAQKRARRGPWPAFFPA